MTPYARNDRAAIYHGDCLETMRRMPDASVDAVVTDPPYGLSKTPDMAEVLRHWLDGDDYTHTGSGFMGKTWDSFVPGPSIWAEALRVLKPGGHMLVFAGTRTQDLMGLAIRLAGFEIRDSLAWLYGSGFPKSLDVSKAIDKDNGRRFEDRFALGRHIRKRREAAGLTVAEVNAWFGYRDGCQHWERQDRSGARVPTLADWHILRTRLGLSDEYRELVERVEAEREVVGTRQVQRGVAFTSNGASVVDVTAPATEESAKWQGWGTALKPAHEPVIVARKPLDGTVAANVLQHGTGALNIDGCRVATDEKLQGSTVRNDIRGGNFGAGHTANPGDIPTYTQAPAGRWPANVALDETQAAALGEPSRFMYVAKAPKKERPTVAGVSHPTVKPLALMRWLVRLVTPADGLVLDPFAGSGATLEAAHLEGFRAVGIELTDEYLPLISARLERLVDGQETA